MLVKDLRKQVDDLEEDLRARSEEEPFADALKTEYDQARKAERTATTYGTWRDERVTQVAVAWVLGTVFVRFCEDNGLIEWPFIAGPGERLTDAVERHEAFFREHPEKNDRDWIVAAFDHLASSHKTVEGLFDKRYNPLWEITPSFEQATALLNFWRRRGDDGEIRYDFTDDDWDTRFLGDLYQDLSEHARKTYALLQTPEFVEEFILDLTLEPAVEEFGLKGLRTIDPTCGSGHFLLGTFERLFTKWSVLEPGSDTWNLIYRSMESIHGCDKNPFAASIARFRLLVAALRAAKKPRLDQAAIFPINVAVGDSLIHGRGAPGWQGGLFDPDSAHVYRTEDVREYASCDILGISSYHVVVGNPPYITVKDKCENENYRRGYTACSGTYALSVPFAQRFFHLAIRTSGNERAAGYATQITANSFMKREFGKKLIEQFFPTVHLTRIIDTSGAHIPGHGTPTVIIAGRNHIGRHTEPVRAVLGVRGEPTLPENPADGLVWSAIVDQAEKECSESEWVTTAEVGREVYSTYPWSLSGGEAAPLFALIDKQPSRLKDEVVSIGRTTATGADDIFFLPDMQTARRLGEADQVRELAIGESIRDYSFHDTVHVRTPYKDQEQHECIEPSNPLVTRSLWLYRSILAERLIFGKSILENGHPWYAHLENYSSKLNTTRGIGFSFVATHNHFSYDRLSRLFNRTAPVIKLNTDANDDDHLALLGVLNSSAACFWLKQVSQDKGNRGGERSTGRYAWESYFEFTGTKLQDFPLPKSKPLELSRKLDLLAQELSTCEPSTIMSSTIPDRDKLISARGRHTRIRRHMIALQEELDWQAYAAYALIAESEAASLVTPDVDQVPEVNLGERAFEISLSPRLESDEAIEQWFARHGSTPTAKIPDHWPRWYQDIVQARIDIIEKRRDIALIERPEYKRRWATVPWEKREAGALRNWLLDRCEKSELWFALRDGMKNPRTLTVSQLADQFRDDADMNSVAQLYATDHLKKRDLTLAQILEQVVADQHVPYLAALRYKDSGLRKREQWEEVWDLQREEDRTGKRLDIPVPPKYGSGDFRKTSYWSQRGKLDVPKERFISYPDASPDSDSTLLLGWAGWDHKDQAQALVNTVNDRTEQSGWTTDRLTPLLTGLLEVMPWVKQWHGEYDPEWDGNPAEEYSAYLADQRAKHQLTEDDLRAWRPAAPTRGRRAAKKD